MHTPAVDDPPRIMVWPFLFFQKPIPRAPVDGGPGVVLAVGVGVLVAVGVFVAETGVWVPVGVLVAVDVNVLVGV